MAGFNGHKVPLRVRQGEVAVDVKLVSRQRNWTPFALRLPFLVFIIVALQFCTVSLEILLRRSGPLPEDLSEASVRRRQVQNATLTYISTPSPASMASPSVYGSSSNLSDAPTSIVTQMTVFNAYGSLASAPHLDITSTTDSVYGSLTSDETSKSTSTSDRVLSSATAPGAYGSLTSDETTPASDASTVVSMTAPAAYGSLTSASAPSSHSSVAPSAEPPNSYGSLTSTPTTQSAEPATSLAPISSYGSLTSGSLKIASTVVVLTTSTVSSFSTDGSVTHVTVVSTFSSTTVRTSTATATHTSSPNILASLGRHDLMMKGTFKHVWYFAAMYIPSIVAVLIKEAWLMVSSSAKLMEPFYRLSRRGGALATNTLCSEYLATAMSWNSIKDAFTGNFHLLAIILINLLMSMLAPLATESMTVDFVGHIVDAQGDKHRADPRWFISTPLIRGLQAVLSFVSACIALIIIFGLGRRSGLSANPSSIASMATLLSDPDVVRDIGEVDPNLSMSATTRMVADRRYALVDYVDENGQDRHGLLKVGGINFQEARRILHHTAMAQIGPMAPQEIDENDIGRVRRSKYATTLDALLIFLLVGLIAVTVGYRFDSTDSGFNQFFNSQRLGPRFVLSTGASLITLGIQNIEQEIRTKAPHRQLARRYASASNTILRRVNGTALTNLFSCLRHRDWFGFLVALAAVLGNVLIIAVVGVPYSSAAIIPAFYASCYVTVIICVLMLMVVVGAFVWRGQNRKMRVPQEPNDNVIRVLMSLCNDGNRLRSMFEGLDDTSDRGLRRHCRNYDRRYWAGWIMDSNGRVRWCVEREGEASLVS